MSKTKSPIDRIKPGSGVKLLKRVSRNIEKVIITILIIMMIGILILATVELGKSLYNTVVLNGFVIGLDSITNLFGGFLLVLIGIELLDTIKVYLKDNVIHVEVVLLVAIIALARKIVILDMNLLSEGKLFAIAALIISLAASYFLIKKAGLMTLWLDKECDDPDAENNEPPAAMRPPSIKI